MQRPDAEGTAPTTPSDLVATLRRACDALASITQKDDVPSSRLQVVGRALVTASAFLQTAEQSAIGALGVDFVAAARWLSGYYKHAAAGLKAQSRPLLFGGNGQALGEEPTATQLGNVMEALAATSSMWREVAEAAEANMPCMASDQEHHFGSASTSACTNCGETAPEPATYPGIVRIWTAVTSSLCNTVTSGRGGSRQEVVVMTQVMVQTAREAAVMAAMLVEVAA